MHALKDKFHQLNLRLFPTTAHLQRAVIIFGALLVLLTVSFAGYYYYDRYYSDESPVIDNLVAEAQQAVRDDPQNVDARLALAEIYMLGGRWMAAIEQAQMAAELAPDDLRIKFILGIAFANSGQPQESIEPLEAFLDSMLDADMLGLNKQYLAALYFLGDSYLQLGQFEAAIAPLEAAVMFNRANADAIYKLAQAYIGLQEYERALLALEEAITFVPDFFEAYQAMSLVYQTLGMPAEENYARGMLAYASQDYSSARSRLTEATTALPDFAPGFVGLGLACEKQADLECALDAYQSAVLLDAENFTANQGILRLGTAMSK